MFNPRNLPLAFLVAIAVQTSYAETTNGATSQDVPSVSERTGLQKRADKTSMEAWEVLRAGRLDDAKYRFNQALLLDSSNALALWGLGIYHAQKGDLEGSRKNFEKADPLLSNDVNFNVDYARTLGYAGIEARNEGMVEEAFERFKKVYEIAPQHRVNLENWAVILYNIGKYPEAWDKIKLAEKTPGGKNTNPKFVAALEKKMARP